MHFMCIIRTQIYSTMHFLSHSQNFEDVYINRIFDKQNSGFYIDVGAHHPEHDSVTKAFYDKGWSGINIEPILESFQYFNEQRQRDINLNIAIGDKEEFLDITYFYNTGLSTLNNDIADMHISESKLEHEKRKVKVKTLNSVLTEYKIEKIDFLKIDVEGLELQVLFGLNLQKYRPTLIMLEDTIPTKRIKLQSSKDIHNYLKHNNYMHVFFDGLNSYFIKNEQAELYKHFDLPVNIFDNFTKTSYTTSNNEDLYLQNQKFRTSIELELDNNKILSNNNNDLLSSIRFLNSQQAKLDILLNNANTNNINHFNQLQHVTNQMNSEINIRDTLILEQENLINLLNHKVNSRLYKTLFSTRKISRIPKKIKQISYNLIPSKKNIKRFFIFLKLEVFAMTMYRFLKVFFKKDTLEDNFGEESFTYHYNLSMPKGKLKYLFMFSTELIHDELIIANSKDKSLYSMYLRQN